MPQKEWKRSLNVLAATEIHDCVQWQAHFTEVTAEVASGHGRVGAGLLYA